MQRNRKGFMMLFVIPILLACLSMTYVAITVVDANRMVFVFLGNLSEFYFSSENAKSVRLAYGAGTSTGSSEDQFSCPGWQVVCRKGNAPVCTTAWEPWFDGIADSCDNNDGKPGFTSGNVTNLLSLDSDSEDDDHYPRTYSLNFFWSGSEDTVLAFNDQIIGNVVANPNNVETDGLALPPSVNELVVRYACSGTGLIVTFYEMDKSAFNADKSVKVLSKKEGVVNATGGILDDSGDFSVSGTPLILHHRQYDYAVNLKNPGNPASCKVWAESGGKRVYSVPTRDDLSDPEFLLARYHLYGNTLVYRYETK